MILAINTWAVPILTYSFGILKWSDADLNGLDRLTRRLLTKFRCLHTNSSIKRLYLPRKEGGRGLVNIYQLCRNQEVQMRNQLISSEDRLMKLVVQADDGYTPLNLSKNDMAFSVTTTQEDINTWQEKSMHGKFPNLLQEQYVDKASSLQWLSDGYVYPETEGFIIAIQDRVIRTKNYEKHCLGMNVVDKCRKCGSVGETIEHVIAGCSSLSESAYLGRHNQLAKIVHQQIALKHRLISTDTPPYYKYNPAPVLEATNVTLYWDRPMITDKTVDHNRPDIVLIDKEQNTATLIDIAVPLTQNIAKTEIQKGTKYENLAMEIKNIWKLSKVYIYPLVMSAEGVVTRNFVKNLEKIGVSHNVLNMGQKAVLLQTCHIVRKFLD